MDFYYCQGISTIVLSFERETRKWSRYKELAGILQFGETGREEGKARTRTQFKTRTRKTGECGTPSALCSTRHPIRIRRP